MNKNAAFHEYVVHDLLVDVPHISSRAMFGGYGIYKDGNIFAIIVDGDLYLKATDETKTFFAERGSHAFTYAKKNGKSYTMNYWFVPEEVLEDREAFSKWIDVIMSVSR
ncbi:MAG: TfoX/Sxy family protein [Patescibacteria group bacterium]